LLSKKEKRLREEIFWLWENYRKEFPLCDKLFSDVISDLCFLLDLTPPWEHLTPILTKEDFRIRPFLLNSYIFDYLFSEEHSFQLQEMNFVLRTVSDQSFRKSKAYRVHSLFASVCEEAVVNAFQGGLFNKKSLNQTLFSLPIPSHVRTVRAMFQGLPAKEIPKTEIDLVYVPLLHDENIRSRCDEIIRYLEHRIRSILKMKNSLSRIHLAEIHKNYIDVILFPYHALTPKDPLPWDKNASQKAEEAVLPQQRNFHFSPEEADEIEEESRKITMALTESYLSGGEELVRIGFSDDSAFDQRYEADLKALEKERVVIDNNEFWEFAALLNEKEDLFIRIALHQGKEFAVKFAMASGAFFEGMIADCNRKAMDSIGDAIFDGEGMLYADYRDALADVFPSAEGEING
jgi:hypothetical protein